MNCICPHCFTLRKHANQHYSCERCKSYLTPIEFYEDVLSPINLKLYQHPINFTLYTEKGFCYDEKNNPIPLPFGANRVIGAEYINDIVYLIPVLPLPEKIEERNIHIFTSEQIQLAKEFSKIRARLIMDHLQRMKTMITVG